MIRKRPDIPDENTLFRLYRDNGDVQALEQLYHRVRPWLFLMIYRITGDADAAEDIHQDVWVKVTARPEWFNAEKGKFANYAYTTAKHAALKWKDKDRKLVRDTENSGVEDIPDVTDASTALDRAERSRRLRKAVRALQEKYRDVILLHYFAAIEVKQIAATFNIPEGTVKTRLARGRKQLEKQLVRWGFP